MHSAPPTPDDADDDALADALADAWVARAATDPALRRLALRAAGLTKAPADMTQEELATAHGTDRHTLNRLALHALNKLRHSPELRTIRP